MTPQTIDPPVLFFEEKALADWIETAAAVGRSSGGAATHSLRSMLKQLPTRTAQANSKLVNPMMLRIDRQLLQEGMGKAIASPEYEHVDLAELIDGLMELSPSTELRDVELEGSAALGPMRLTQVKEVLFRVWETDRMI